MSWNPETRPTRSELQNRVLNAFSDTPRQGMTFAENSPYTDQGARDECDINFIMARYMATGELPPINQVQPQWLDATQMDFHEHMNAIRTAQEYFDAIPSSIRDKMQNSPAVFLDFVSREENRAQLEEWGMLNPTITNSIPQNMPAGEPTDVDG